MLLLLYCGRLFYEHPMVEFKTTHNGGVNKLAFISFDLLFALLTDTCDRRHLYRRDY